MHAIHTIYFTSELSEDTIFNIRFFLVVAALQITTIDKISVKERPKTWRLVVALVAIAIGLVTFGPVLSRAYSQTSTQTPSSAAEVTEPLTPPSNAAG